MGNGEVQKALRSFVAERNWDQFHTSENLAKSISIEAGELLECFQWGEGDLSKVADELADVLTYCYLLSDKLGLDVSEIVLDKLSKTAKKYPIDKAYGNSKKYDELQG